MREVQISDAELQALIAPPIRERLKAAGFQTGASVTASCGVFLPVFLDMAGSIEVERTEDGMWTFRQELNVELADRTADALHAHVESIGARLRDMEA